MLGGGLAPSICSILPVSRTTLAGRRKNGGVVTVSIPSRRRSSNGLIKGQGVVRECQSGLVFLLYHLYTYLTLHHLPFRDIEDELAGLYNGL